MFRLSPPMSDPCVPTLNRARRRLCRALVRGLMIAPMPLGVWSCRPRGPKMDPAGGGVAIGRRQITIKGSDTMVTLGQRWAEVYMNLNQDVIVQVTGGGSGTGISALINGTTDICQASRKMRDKEEALMLEKHGQRPVEFEVARDGLAVYVRADNPVDEISTPALKAVFRGKLTNWRDLGGPDAPIVLYSRENNSGTYEFFKELVLGGADFAAAAQTMPGTAAVVNAVSKERWGIGYGGAAYGRGIKILRVSPEDGGTAVLPNESTVRDGSYPLSRPLLFYVLGQPQGEIKRFIDWVLGPEGQSLVTTVGYYPV